MRIWHPPKPTNKGAGKLARLFCSFAVLWFSATAVHAQAVALRWKVEANQKPLVEVTGLPVAALQRLQRVRWQVAQWQKLLAVYTESADVPMLGAYQVQAGALRFAPQFPLEAGLSYRAEFRPVPFITAKAKVSSLTETYRVPARDLTPTTIVAAVYPSGSTVPENLLKFYLHFSAPMQRGEVYQYIELRDAADKTIELPFLELDEELWNPTFTRLTLFIDPGRIKRGVLPLEQIGPSLEAGKSYSLLIRRAWKDANGALLKADFQKAFRVVAPDREPPDHTRWQVQAPPVGARKPLIVNFAEPMERALALRLITVTNAAGQSVTGQTALTDGETRWSFTPSTNWLAGAYALVIRTTIEDLAGNNIGKPFEVDVFTGIDRHLTSESVKLSFEVR